MIKIVVSSFYNTLIDYEEAIPSSTMLEIDRIRSKNILFTISTNRSYLEILDYNKDFPFVDYIISLNGSYVYDVLNKKCIYKQKIAKLDVKKIYNSFKRSKIYYYTVDKILTNYNETLNKDIYKMEIEGNEDVVIDNDNCLYTTFEKDDKKYLEIISNKCNSYKALSKILEKNNIKDSEVLTIIGNESDLSLNKIKETYIVENLSCKLKNIKNTTKSNNEKGVELVLQKIK